MAQARWRTFIRAVGDALIIVMAYGGAYGIRFGTFEGLAGYFSISFMILITAGYLVVFYLFEHYEEPRKTTRMGRFGRIALGVAGSATMVAVLKYVFFLFPVGRGFLVIANMLAVIGVFIWREAALVLFRMIYKPTRVLIVGSGGWAQKIMDLIQEETQDYRLVSVPLEDPREAKGSERASAVVPVLGGASQMADLAEIYHAGLVVLAAEGGLAVLSVDNLLRAYDRSVEVVGAGEMFQRLTGRIPIDLVPNESWFLTKRGFSIANHYLAAKIKRMLDLAVGTVLLLLGLPFWPIIALMIKAESRGPVFYSQNRIGKNGLPFCLYKFRSMIDRAERSEPVWASANDHRVTRVGKILRALHLDEWPQFWNVLKGNMSLVGPRPERPEFVAELKEQIPFYDLRHFVKPGLTGWAQLNYGYAASAEDSKIKLEYDLYYICQMNLLFDLHIVARTVARVFFRERQL
jgi:exopolysaccharide biosynthesis polyprenyl glycosylphosphotransferase